MQYNFEWDPTKAKTNRTKHDISFEEAATVFKDPQMLTLYDGIHSKTEDRWITLGLSITGRLLVVSHTFPGSFTENIQIRIISTRKATSLERRQYQGK